MKFNFILILMFFLGCSSPEDFMSTNITSKNLADLKSSMIVSNDTIQSIFDQLNIQSPIIRINRSLIALANYSIPSVLVYDSLFNISKTDICNAHFPNFYEKTTNKWDEDNFTASKENIPAFNQLLNDLNLPKPEKDYDFYVFYFYDINYEIDLQKRVKDLYLESLKQQNVKLYLVNANNHLDLEMTPEEFIAARNNSAIVKKMLDDYSK